MAGGLANQLVSLLVLPILTRYLAPADYGRAALFMAFVGFAVPTVGMNMRTHVARNYFKVPRERMAAVSWNSALAVAINLAILLPLVVGLSLAFPEQREALFGVPVTWVAIGLILAAAQSISAHLTAFLRVQGKPLLFAGFEFASAALNLGLSLAFVVSFGMGWQGRSGAMALSGVAAAIVAVVAMRKLGYLTGGVEWSTLRPLYAICLPLVPHAFSAQVTLMSSRFFLNGFAGAEAVGLYAVGHTFGSLLHMPVDAFGNAWTPWIYGSLAKRDSEHDHRIVRGMYLAALGILGLWAAVAVVGPAGLRLVTNERYHGAGGYVALVALAYAFQGMYTLLIPILTDEGKTGGLAVISAGVAAMSVVLNWVLIPRFGGYGAAYALVVCSLVRLVAVFWHTRRVRPLPWSSLRKLASLRAPLR